MHKRLMDLTDVALYELEVKGPELIGMIEIDMHEQYMFEGALIPTTERLFVNVFDKYGNVLKREIPLEDITNIKLRKMFLLDDTVEIWIGSEVLIRMYGIKQMKLGRFKAFIQRHRARKLHIGDNEVAV